jgi:ubiquinone/menaquinone biosynthesis C-methylase UbiE
MGVASHLGIKLSDYDARIRSFIPDYEEMLGVAAAALPPHPHTIVDLGIGTGALSARCVEAAPRCAIVGIDADAEILALAARRLGDRGTFVAGTFLRTPLPACDAVVASFALHHVRTRTAKSTLYRRIRAALRGRGRLISVDAQPARDAAIRRSQRAAWLDHLQRAYNPKEAAALLAAWATEDVYVPLEAEIELMTRAGFAVDVLWRKGVFAVLLGA